jgi:hypothetical protein
VQHMYTATDRDEICDSSHISQANMRFEKRCAADTRRLFSIAHQI